MTRHGGNLAEAVMRRGRSPQGGWIAIFLALLLPAPPAPLAAGPNTALAEPRPVSASGKTAAEARLAVDSAGNALIAMIVDGKARVRLVGSTVSSDTLLSDIRISDADPWIEAGARGQAFVVFTQEDNELGARGREVYLATSPGGSFTYPLNVSRNKIDDHSPRLALDANGSPRLVWVQGTGAGAQIYHYDHRRNRLQLALTGEKPALAVSPSGPSYLAFLRGDSLLVSELGAAGFMEPALVDRGVSRETHPWLGLDGRGRLCLVYVAGRELRLVVRSDGPFGAARILERELEPPSPLIALAPPFLAGPRLDAIVGGDGRLVAAYLKEGDVFVIRGEIDGDLSPERITATPEMESSPSAREDAAGNLHLSFIRGGRVYYTNSSPSPQADFALEGADGELPLTVSFQDLSAGEVRVWRWTFGDGGTSTERHPVHTYMTTGRYTVTLEVFGPGGESKIERTEIIIVREPSYTLSVPDLDLLPEQTDVWVPVFGYHREPVQGFQVAGRFDPAVLKLRDLNLDDTITSAYSPEFFAQTINNARGYFTSGVILDYVSPFDGRLLPAGDGQRLVHLVLDVMPGIAGADTQIELGDGIGESLLGSMYAVEGQSMIPVLEPGTMHILPAQSPAPKAFLRGDVDGTDFVNLTDAVLLLGLLFNGDELSSCADASDANDSGTIDISDPISLLGYLFLSGPALAYPYPSAGLDPTLDELPSCLE